MAKIQDPNLASLLSIKLEDIKKMAPLPAGEYRAIIHNYSVEQTKSKNNALQINFNSIEAGPDIEADQLGGYDLSKYDLRKSFFLTDKALWRLKAFLDSFNIPGASQQAISEVVPKLVGAPVLVTVGLVTFQNGDVGNEVTDVVGIAL